MTNCIRTLLCLLLFNAAAAGQRAAEAPGLKIGKKAPNFELKDQTGKMRSLQKMLKDGSVAVVFHRSADW